MQNRMKYSTSFGNINYGATAQVFKNAPVTFYYCATRVLTGGKVAYILFE